MRGPVDERFVALIGTDLLVQPVQCGHTRVFGLTTAGPKTLHPALHVGPLAAAAAIFPANPGPLALPTWHPPPYGFCLMLTAPCYLMDSDTSRNEYFPWSGHQNARTKPHALISIRRTKW